MQMTKETTGVTFAVDDVTPATEALPECRTHEALRELLGGIESCHDYHGMTVKDVGYQPLLAAVYMAFSQHRPLVLTPDSVWITIAQGIAQHMAIHGERLRSRFVSHQGKLDLVFACEDWVEGSPENPWALAFESWAGQIQEHVGAQIHDALICDFTTTGPTERAVSQIVLMDIFERYFHYACIGICGIPTVTLEGKTVDWLRLAAKVRRLRIFQIDWWLDHLEPICEQFVRASVGHVDSQHWQSVCKLRNAYGGDIINGWVAKLFPYLRAFVNGPCNRINPIFETGVGFSTLVAPSGLSHVPFTWRNRPGRQERLMEVVGGLVGVTQDRETMALRPKIGWAIREAEPFDLFLSRLGKDHVTFPGAKVGERGDAEGLNRGAGLSAEISKFYYQTDGAELFGKVTDAKLRIFSLEEVEPLDSGEDRESLWSYGPRCRAWHKFAAHQDGSWFAINLDLSKHRAPWAKQPHLRQLEAKIGYHKFAPICYGSTDEHGKSHLKSVIALSFGELLQRFLESSGQAFWLDPGFSGYGDAELFTRRKLLN